MNCPTCHISLHAGRCDGCHGRWVDASELSRIDDLYELEFDQGERAAIATSLESVALPGPRGQLQCPQCRVFMEQVRLDLPVSSGAVLVDRCPDHGLWLGVGEADELAAIILGKLGKSGSVI